MRDLLREAAEWRLLGLLFACPWDGWREQISALAGEVEDGDLRSAARQALEQASEGLYHSIFGPGGPAPPREVSHRDLIETGSLLSELSCYFDAFAYRPATQEPLDHVSVGADFIGYLRLKEEFALANANAEHAAVTREAAQRFLEDHLSTIAGPLAARLSESRIGYLTLASAALLRRTGPPPAPPVRALPLAEIDGEMTCS